MLPGVVLVAIGSGALWSGLVTWLRTRGPRPSRLPDEGPVPAAVVAALRNRLFLEAPAVLNTAVFELAEKGVLAIEPADSVHPAMVRAAEIPHASTLPQYQASVVSRLLRRQGDHDRAVPLSALQPGEDAAARAWHKRFVREVREEASRRGLLRRPVDAGVHVMFALLGVVCAGSVGATVAHYARPNTPLPFAVFVATAALEVATVHWAARVRLTPTGRRLLAAQQSVPDPEAEVAHLLRPELALPAMAPAPQAGARVLPNQLQPLPAHLVWSDYGGAWHPVNVQSQETYSLGGSNTAYVPLAFFAAISLGGAVGAGQPTQIPKLSIAVFAGLPIVLLLTTGVRLLRRRRLPKRAVLLGQVAKLWSSKHNGTRTDNESFYCTLDVGRGPESVRLRVSRKFYQRLQVGQLLEVTVNPRRKRIISIRFTGPAT